MDSLLFLLKLSVTCYNECGDFMNSIRETLQYEWQINKSRFIGFLAPVQTITEVTAFLNWCQTNHPQATHVCYAYILSSVIVAEKAFDDGEPQKTAGFPMLEILKKKHLTDVVAVVVRYFGGIKLGAGGLIRAYAKTIRCCTDNAILTFPVEYDECRLETDIESSGAIGSYLRLVAELTNESYGESAVFFFSCAQDKTKRITEEIKKRTASDHQVEIVRSYRRFL